MILVSDWLEFHADRTPDKLAMVDQGKGRKFTYYQLNMRGKTYDNKGTNYRHMEADLDGSTQC